MTQIQPTPSLSPEHSPEQSPAGPRPLVRHARRAAWGRGLVVWERENKRACLFEDGRLRVFVRDYFSMLEPAASPDPEVRIRLRAHALAEGHLVDPKLAGRSKTKRNSEPVPTVADQVEVFESLYPGCFHGDPWTDEMRHRDGRRVKRLRDPAMVDAVNLLGRSELRTLIDAGEHADVLGRVVKVLGRTNVVSRSQLSVFRDFEADAELARALFGYLHEVRQGELQSMARLRVALAKRGVARLPWPLLTAPRALLYPADHMWVRPALIRKQAKSIMPALKLGSQPSAADYSRCLEVAMGVREKLTRERLAPRDLFDVVDFMQVTLAPKTRDRLYGAMSRRLATTTSVDV